MSVFSVPIAIADNDRREWRELSAMVDTGAFASSVPGSVLRDLGVSPVMEMPFQLADGSVRVMDVAHTWVRVNGLEVMTNIAFNDEYTTPLLGALALETLMLSVDPDGQRLIPWQYIRDYSRFLPYHLTGGDCGGYPVHPPDRA